MIKRIPMSQKGRILAAQRKSRQRRAGKALVITLGVAAIVLILIQR